jgi:hypothetical protein
MTMTTMIDKILAKAEALEQQAAALRLTATILNGDAHAQKRKTAARTVAGAVKVRRAQRNGATPDGARPEVDETPPAEPVDKRLTRQKKKAGREQKRDRVLAIIRDYGKPMPLNELRQEARAQGITSLTGMIAYVRAGFLHKTGGKGKTRYRFRQLPAADPRSV